MPQRRQRSGRIRAAWTHPEDTPRECWPGASSTLPADGRSPTRRRSPSAQSCVVAERRVVVLARCLATCMFWRLLLAPGMTTAAW
eukprot:5864636-Prymnesium_polylepis.1